jgi:phospholipid/cholesterol/gamma-HCH transport system ATP-binding protein
MPNQPANTPSHTSPDPLIEVDSLVRKFGDSTVLDGISFNVYPGDTFVIMGGSGCGKSTLLRHLIGAEIPTSGSIKVLGQDITSASTRELEAVRRQFGMLFQSGALLQSLTVAENVALPLIEHASLDPNLVDLVVKMKLEQVGLTGHGDKKPSEISGGMKKRVALARALVLDPPLVFSDEPTAGLDPIMTAVIDDLTKKLTQKIGATAVVVTHDMASIFRIATRIIMLGTGDQQGRIVIDGTPDEIKNSTDPMVRQFVGGHSEGPIPYRSEGDNYSDMLLAKS